MKFRWRCELCGRLVWPHIKGCRPCQQKLMAAMWLKLMETLMANRDTTRDIAVKLGAPFGVPRERN